MTAEQHTLLLSARHWMQSALEALSLCPSAHPGGLLADGHRLLDEVDALLRSKVRLVDTEPSQAERELETTRSELEKLGRRLEAVQVALNECGEGYTGESEAVRVRRVCARAAGASLQRRLDELDGALAVVAKALRSPEALVRAAQAIEGKAKYAGSFESASSADRIQRANENSGGSDAAHSGGRLMPGPTVATAGTPELAGGLRCERCNARASHVENFYDRKRAWCAEHVPWSGHGEFCGEACRALSCECLDWTQVGHPASAYWPNPHPSYHHPDCEKYVPPPKEKR